MHEETTAEGKKVKFGYRCGIFFPMSAKSTQQLANPLLTTWSSGTTVLAGARQKDAKSRSKACGRLLALKSPREMPETLVCNRELALGLCAASLQALWSIHLWVASWLQADSMAGVVEM